VPYCVTIDHESLEAPSPDARTATLRDRDSKSQERVTLEALIGRLQASRIAPRPSPLNAVG
jgi:glycyl-tRNA synthetase (class II)